MHVCMVMFAFVRTVVNRNHIDFIVLSGQWDSIQIPVILYSLVLNVLMHACMHDGIVSSSLHCNMSQRLKLAHRERQTSKKQQIDFNTNH